MLVLNKIEILNIKLNGFRTITKSFIRKLSLKTATVQEKCGKKLMICLGRKKMREEIIIKDIDGVFIDCSSVSQYLNDHLFLPLEPNFKWDCS